MSNELTISTLNKYQRNPRKITASKLRILAKGLQLYGDLSGIVYNVAKKELVGGNQRTTTFNSSTPIVITHRYDTPTPQGTTALGYVEENGERFQYREVSWDDQKHMAAAILANEAGGDWDWPELKAQLAELDDGAFDMEETGFEIPEIENLFGDLGPTGDPNKQLDYSALDGEDVSGKLNEMSDGVRKAILIEFNPEHYQEGYDLVKYWRDSGANVGLMLIAAFKAEKEKLKENA